MGAATGASVRSIFGTNEYANRNIKLRINDDHAIQTFYKAIGIFEELEWLVVAQRHADLRAAIGFCAQNSLFDMNVSGKWGRHPRRRSMGKRPCQIACHRASWALLPSC
ncbi:hypothetical protein P609_15035 [Comamonas thiooxydans]|nr:hypothetical protein P609_15035 [Comamonas thiooxydans]